MGSLAEWREFSSSPEKPPCGFWDRSPAPLMAARGWEGEWRLLETLPIRAIERLSAPPRHREDHCDLARKIVFDSLFLGVLSLSGWCRGLGQRASSSVKLFGLIKLRQTHVCFNGALNKFIRKIDDEFVESSFSPDMRASEYTSIKVHF